MTPEALKEWQAIFRDVVVVVLAAFMLTYETVVAETPNAYLVGAGLTLLGIPAAVRADAWRRKDEGGG